MVKNMRCPDCGRKRKNSHEKIQASRDSTIDKTCAPLLRHPENRNPIMLRVRQLLLGSSIQKAT